MQLFTFLGSKLGKKVSQTTHNADIFKTLNFWIPFLTLELRAQRAGWGNGCQGSMILLYTGVITLHDILQIYTRNMCGPVQTSTYEIN